MVRENARRALLWGFLVLLLGAVLVPVGAMTLSVRVQGTSMNPTLHEGDRLLLNPLSRDAIHRFDLVHATLGDTRIHIVKRVIGLPGDDVAVAPVLDAPEVFVRPHGSHRVYRVENPTWSAQVGARTLGCCRPDGTEAGERAWVRVPDGEYWLVGDNWGGSEDSRRFGFVPEDRIAGRLNLRVLPLGALGRVATPARLVAVPAS